MQGQETETITAEALLQLLMDVLADDVPSKSSIRSDYSRFRRRVSDSEAGMLAAFKHLKRLIADSNSKGVQGAT